MNAIYYTKYERIGNIDYAKSIFDFLRMTHEGNEQVNETNPQALIQRYKSFKMEEYEIIDDMFSMFQTLFFT